MSFRLSRISHPRATLGAAALVTLFLLAFGTAASLAGTGTGGWQDRQGVPAAQGSYPPAVIRHLQELFCL